MQADDSDDIVYHRGLAEYLATLVSAEGGDRVRQVLEADRGESKTKQDENFEDTLSSVFGRAPEFSQNSPADKGAKDMHLTDEDLDAVRVIRTKPTR